MRNLTLSIKTFASAILLLVGPLVSSIVFAEQPTPGFNYKIPESIMTPDKVETSIGTLEFFDGMPSRETTQKVFDNLDTARGMEVFLNMIPATSLEAMHLANREMGVKASNYVLIFDELMDSPPLFLTGNTDTVYASAILDLKKDGPTIVEVPPGSGPGTVNDAFFRFVTDMGGVGPDRGKGGTYLILPPDYKGNLNYKEGSAEVEMKIGGKMQTVFVSKSPSYINWLILRGFLVDGKPDTASKMFREGLKIYPLSKVESQPEMHFINGSGKFFNSIHANDYHFYKELDEVIQREHVGFIDPELRGLMASIGIQKDKKFAPDARMQKILTDAVAIGNATARATYFNARMEGAYKWKGKLWKTAFVGGDYKWLIDGGKGGRYLDARTFFFYMATVNTPAMALELIGKGSQYVFGDKDKDGNYLYGDKTYKLNIPANVPAKDFWSVVVYDPQTRSQLQTSKKFPSKNNKKAGLVENKDGSVDLYFGPSAPKGMESNWIETVPGKGWFVLLRLYGPLKPWFDKTWQPGDFELIEQEAPLAHAEKVTPGYNNKIPTKIMTSDIVKASIGTLHFSDGMPSGETVNKIYDNLDLMRGVDVFLNFVPAASLEGMLHGMAELGAPNSNQVIIFDKLGDSNVLFLTGNTDTVYTWSIVDLKKDGPTVIELPAGSGPGTINDAFFRFVVDMGSPGPDRKKGGTYIILPPDYEGKLKPTPNTFKDNSTTKAMVGDEMRDVWVAQSTSYHNWMIHRGFLVDGKPDAATKNYKEHLKVYPLSKASNPPKMKFISGSGKAWNTIHANNFEFFEELDRVIQREPIDFIDPELRGVAASIGIVKGQKFAPDARMKRILVDAAKIGNATARTIWLKPRDKSAYFFDDRQWYTGFVGGDYKWLKDGGIGGRYLDARTLFFYMATVNTPAMVLEIPGVGSNYAMEVTDKNGNYLDGSKNYKVNIPANVPAKDFWSVVVYDPQTRSELQTDQLYPSINNKLDKLTYNKDGSVDLYFGPEAPKGKKSNWIQTVPGKNWFTILRLYGPLQPWFDRVWKPGDIELVE